ncbi:MAG: hypothetical protein MI864_00180 [Pseudomonadales bacterium]|nr:hypothetical protein [Pseudomonadales bacterium]
MTNYKFSKITFRHAGEERTGRFTARTMPEAFAKFQAFAAELSGRVDFIECEREAA